MKTSPLLPRAPRRSRRVAAGLIAAAIAGITAVAWSPASGGAAPLQPAVVDPLTAPIIASDTFNRGDGGLGVADVGGVWAFSGAVTWGIVSQQAATIAAPGEGIAVLDTGKANVSVSADITLSSSSQGSLTLRALDRNDQLLAGLVLTATTNKIGLFKYVAPTYTELDPPGVSPAGLVAGQTYNLRVDAVGRDIKVYVDGTEYLSYSLSDAELAQFGARTKHGLRSTSGDSGTRWDNFVVRDLTDPGTAPPVADWFDSVTPKRFLDTRSATGTFDAGNVVAGPVGAGSTTVVNVRNRGGVPADATAVVLNVTAVGPAAAGFATVYPCDEPRPVASNLNYQPGQDIPNAVIAKLAADGTVCIFTDKATHLLADVNGWFTI
jgi:hypothetical protein